MEVLGAVLLFNTPVVYLPRAFCVWSTGRNNKHGKGAPRAGKSWGAQVLLCLLPQESTLQFAGYRIIFITIFRRRNWGTQLEGIQVPRKIPLDALFS